MLICSLHSALPSPTPPCSNSGIHQPHLKTGLFEMQRRRRRRHPLKIFASCGRDNYDGKLVDEDMIVLRMRIHDMKMAAEMQDGDHKPPANWMQWEKRYYDNYNSDIFEAVGLLQAHLMNTRPCVFLGMLALITLSVPISTAALLDIFKGILLAH